MWINTVKRFTLLFLLLADSFDDHVAFVMRLLFDLPLKGLEVKWYLTNTLCQYSQESTDTYCDRRVVLKMYIVEDKGGAIALMVGALLFLGTWPALLTLLERRGRLPQHTYLDYSITNLLAAVIIALTFGQIGDSKPNMPNFFTQLSQVCTSVYCWCIAFNCIQLIR